jgi:predicted ATPase
MLRTLHVRGYRSLRDFRLTLGRITVVTGGNGVGKSNQKIAEHPDAKITRLVNFEGETRREGEESGKRVWTFDG